MARGFFSGVIAGALVSGLGLGVLSVMTDLPGATPPEATELEVPAGSEFNQSRDDEATSLPAVEGSPESQGAPQVSAPEPDDLTSLSGADTEPAAQPETGTAEGNLSEPAAGAEAAGVEVDSDSPVLPSPQSQAPEAPEGEEDLSISTDPAQPAMPELEAESGAFPQEEPAEAAPETSDAPATEPVTATDEPTQDGADMAGDSEPAQTGITESETKTDEATTETVGESDLQIEESEADAASSIIGDLAPEVKTNRLPSVGDPVDDSAETAEETAPEPAPEADPAEDPRPPLERFAAEFDNPEGKPLMAIVLIDDGSGPIGLDALASFPYPISFAVDASWPGATAAMKRYREAGFEVLLMADLPDGASAQDVEVAMQAYLAAVPEAVAVMEGTGSGLQTSREAVEQLAPILLDSGHGAVLFPKGLNTAQKLLAREGVPAASIFRDFDAKGQSATVIRRFLDQAAFKARQEEAGVIMLGRLRPDTVSALLLWGLQDRASSVALAPVSALLRGG